MKNILFFIFVLLSQVSILGQSFIGVKSELFSNYEQETKQFSTFEENEPDVQPNLTTKDYLDNKYWVIEYIDWITSFREIRFYYFSNSTSTIDGKHYKSLLYHSLDNQSNVVNTKELFRAEDKKLWLRFDTLDVLLEDFNLKVGDTLFAKNGNSKGENFIITQTDTVTYLDGQRRLKYSIRCETADSNFTDGPSIVEGISALDGLFAQTQFCSLIDPSKTREIRCYYEDNNLVYKSDVFEDCFIVSTEDKVFLGVRIFPNPITNMTSIDIPNAVLPLHFEISNISGQMITQATQYNQRFDIDLSHVTSGIYIIRVHDGQGNVYISKVVKD